MIYLLTSHRWTVQRISDDISFIFLYYDLDFIFTPVEGVCADRIPAFHDTVLDMGVVADIYVV